MVNGKPSLVYGGGQPAATTAAKSRDGRFNRIGDSFSSLLPQQGAAAPATQAAQQTQARPAYAQAAAPDPGRARFHPGNIPDNYLSANAKTFASHGARIPLPPSVQSRAEAHAKGAPQTGAGQNARQTPIQAQTMAQTMAQAQMAQRLPSSAGPRISGRPVTGRGDIGMVDTRGNAKGQMGIGMFDSRQNSGKFKGIGMEDTRKGAGGYSPHAERQAAANQAAPAVDGARLYSAHEPFVSPRPQTDDFSQYATRFGRDISGRSFLAYGFAGKNAEQALKNLGYDLSEARTVQTTATLLQAEQTAPGRKAQKPQPDKTSKSRGAQAGENAANAARPRKQDKKSEALPAGSYPGPSLVNNFYSSASRGLGNLAAKFESGDEGIAAIGYDRTGGTSYGKYQIASRPGTMSGFLRYLEDKAPDLAKRLTVAGPANTGGRSGKMPAEWRKISEENPDRFEQLQSDFIRTSHFEPAMQAIYAATGVNFEQMPTALQEVLFSTAVQHGPAGATRIFSQALRRVDAGKLNGEGKNSKSASDAGQQLITHVYNLRAGQFASSTSRVQGAVRSRLQREMREAMQMLA